MENIGFFLSGCEAYGCPKTDIFQTVDLYEAQNIPQVSSPTRMPFIACACPYISYKSAHAWAHPDDV